MCTAIFEREVERLKTYDNWPLSWLEKEKLAQTGMFYTGENDKVKCYFCQVEIRDWSRADHPVSKHLRQSPNCPLLRRHTTDNVPINAEALEHTLSAITYDVCAATDRMSLLEMPAAELRQHAYEQGTISPARMSPVNSKALPTTYSPNYAIESQRLRTFFHWPRQIKQTAEQLAEAGFFYKDVGDWVECFSCGGGLGQWEESDDPWEQHALKMYHCPFVNSMKGKEYIDNVHANYYDENGKPRDSTTQCTEAITTTSDSSAAAGSTLLNKESTSEALINTRISSIPDNKQ